MIALYAGSFHPPTVGHMDIIERSAEMFEKLYVAVMFNAEKKYTMDVDTRISMLRKITEKFENVEIVSDTGLTSELAERLGAGVLVRGIRNTQDLEYEMPIAHANKALTGVETVFLPARCEHSWVSSSIVNDILRHNGDISNMVPEEIKEDILRENMRTSKGV